MTALTVLLLVVSYVAYARTPRFATGALLGLAACVAGMTLQHGGNHGGLSASPTINRIFGTRCCLLWRRHEAPVAASCPPLREDALRLQAACAGKRAHSSFAPDAGRQKKVDDRAVDDDDRCC